jgi:hypothetical protein
MRGHPAAPGMGMQNKQELLSFLDARIRKRLQLRMFRIGIRAKKIPFTTIELSPLSCVYDTKVDANAYGFAAPLSCRGAHCFRRSLLMECRARFSRRDISHVMHRQPEAKGTCRAQPTRDRDSAAIPA